jgi:integrase
MARLESDHGRLLVTFQLQGKRCREYVGLTDTRDNRRAAQKLLREIELELATGQFNYASRFSRSKNLERLGLTKGSGAVPTLAEFGRHWIEERRMAGRITDATAYDYGLILDAHVVRSDLADKRLDEIHDGHINALIGELRTRPGVHKGSTLGPRRINMTRGLLHAIFVTAQRRKLVPENPVVYVEKLRERKSEVDPLTLEEVRALVSAAKGQEYAIFTVLIFAGLRPSELLALRRQDINFDRGIIIVARNLTRFGEGLPKTSYSEREVDMLAPVRAALAEQQGRVGLKSTLVFCNRVGGPLSLKEVRGAWFRLLRLARLRERPLYQCRHTYATLLLSEGLNPLYVAHQMGHATVAMVVRHYARWTRKPNRSDAERVERALAAAGLIPPKMPEICQKAVDSNPLGEHINRAQVRGIARKIGNAERWPSGRRHQIANLAYWATGTEGSNPSLSAKIKSLFASRVITDTFHR